VNTDIVAILVIVACVVALVAVFRTQGHKQIEQERSQDPWDWS